MAEQVTRQKPGPKADPRRAARRQMFSEMSDRTFARYWKANSALAELMRLGVIDSDVYSAVLKLAVRPNGSFNVSRFVREVDVMCSHL